MKEVEIRPDAIFEEYLRLAALDAELFFDEEGRIAIPCPACGAVGCPVFRKHGFQYEECGRCRTLFVSPRPTADRFFRYYRDSESARFFATTFYRNTADARRRLLWKPKAEQLIATIRAEGIDGCSVVDIGGGYGILAEELREQVGWATTIIEPGPDLAAICRSKGFDVVEQFLERVRPLDLPDAPRAFVSFELFEHLHDPRAFLRHLGALAAPGDLFVFTTLSGLGLDIRVLWEASRSFSLQHLNFMNPRSVRLLLEAEGFEVLEVTTPGKLDIDILRRCPTPLPDRFWNATLAGCDEEEARRWQDLIAALGASSHMRVVARRR